MDWYDHPKYVSRRKEITKRFLGSVFRFRRLRPIYFVCGGFESPRRERLIEFLAAREPTSMVFRADDVWMHIAKRTTHNALEMEKDLAELADAVIVIVESPGTFAELGAFSVGAALRTKLLPILDRRYRDAESFINTGPIRWVDSDSKFRPSIYTSLDAILTSGSEVLRRLDIVRRGPKLEVKSLKGQPRLLLYLLLDLLAVIGPVTGQHCERFLTELTQLDESERPSAEYLLGLGVALCEVEYVLYDAHYYYYRPATTGAFESYVNRRMLDLSLERLANLDVLQQIPAALSVLKAVTK